MQSEDTLSTLRSMLVKVDVLDLRLKGLMTREGFSTEDKDAIVLQLKNDIEDARGQLDVLGSQIAVEKGRLEVLQSQMNLQYEELSCLEVILSSHQDRTNRA